MSREIKFRAWDNYDNEMIYPDGNGYFWIDSVSAPILVDALGRPCAINDAMGTPDLKIIQYTGLKDKNGTEVYEGDVVMLPYITPLGHMQWNDIKEPEKYRHEIVFSHGGFCIKKAHHNEPLKEWCKSERGEYIGNYGNKKIIKDVVECEVIGNIYENPELL